jgi:hypothetical protein
MNYIVIQTKKLIFYKIIKYKIDNYINITLYNYIIELNE